MYTHSFGDRPRGRQSDLTYLSYLDNLAYLTYITYLTYHTYLTYLTYLTRAIFVVLSPNRIPKEKTDEQPMTVAELRDRNILE